jgi:putative PEP-CTERM system histidine kinase
VILDLQPRGHRESYDYREQWVALTKRLSSLLGVEEIAKGLAESVAEASGGTSTAVYLVETAETAYHLTACVGSHPYPRVIGSETGVPAWLRTTSVPLPIPLVFRSVFPAGVAVALRWQATLLGFIVIGPHKTSEIYDAEDIAFFATAAEQATAPLVAARLYEDPQRRPVPPRNPVSGAIIHDIKNSVATLSLITRNAASHFHDPEFQRDTVATLGRTIARLQRLLLHLTSPGTKMPTATLGPIDLHALVVEATTPLAFDAKVRLVRRLRPVGVVCGESDALFSVIENLIVNAVEAIDNEGVVTVTVTEESGRAVISVSDTGRGIRRAFQERHLFSPYRSTKNGGWGLGLHHAKQVIESQGGEILVESTEGHGTTFTVKLPLASGQ